MVSHFQKILSPKDFGNYEIMDLKHIPITGVLIDQEAGFISREVDFEEIKLAIRNASPSNLRGRMGSTLISIKYVGQSLAMMFL